MKKLSFWAKKHKQEARLFIILSFILLNITGITIGLFLKYSGIFITYNFFSFLLFLYFTGIAAYPFKHLKEVQVSSSRYYAWQKSCDLVIVAATLGIFIFIGNRYENPIGFLTSANATSVTNIPHPADSSIKKIKTIKEFSTSIKDGDGNLLKWKERKKLLKEQVKSIKRSNDLSKGEKTLLVILSILVALGLIALITALACNLSCSGSDAAAAIVGIGGTGLIIFLTIIAIRAIYGKKRKRKIKPEPE